MPSPTHNESGVLEKSLNGLVDDKEYINTNTDINNANITNSWDGYSKIDNVPEINASENRKMSDNDLLREKFKYIRLLEDLEKKGALWFSIIGIIIIIIALMIYFIFN